MSLEVDLNRVTVITETLQSFVEQMREKRGMTELTVIVKN